MTELEIYKFIQENSIEWHRQNNDGTEDVIIFINDYQLEDFFKVFEPSVFDDEGINCTLKHGYVCLWMNDICEYYGIEMNNIFIGENG